MDDVNILSPTTVRAGRSLQLHLAYSDGGRHARAILFLDTDRNPYNGNTARVASRSDFEKTAAPKLISVRAGTSGVARGTYYVGVKITDNRGLTRYAYAAQAVTIS